MPDGQPGTTVDSTATGTGGTAGTTADSSSLSEEDRKELESLRAGKQQWLGERSQYEEEKRRNEDLERALIAARTGSPSTAANGQDPRLAVAYANLIARAAEGQEDALIQLAQINAQNAVNQRLALETALAQIPLADQQRVRAICEANPGAIPRQVYDQLKSEDAAKGMSQREKDLADREAKLKAQEEEQARLAQARANAGNAGAAATTRHVTGQELSERNPIKASEQQARIAQAEKEGRSDLIRQYVREGEQRGILMNE